MTEDKPEAAIVPAGPAVPLVVVTHRSTPVIPSHGPYWSGKEDVVPTPQVIKADPALMSAGFAGSYLWSAVTGTWSAQVHGRDPDREIEASKLRSQAWKQHFMAAHEEMFNPTPEGGRVAIQFHVGLYLVPRIRQAAIAALFPEGIPHAWIPWLGDWGQPVVTRNSPGYCYSKLFLEADLAAVARRMLGPDPFVASVLAFADTYRLQLIPGFYAQNCGGGRYHICDPDDEGAMHATLSAAAHGRDPALRLLPGNVRLGSEPSADGAAVNLKPVSLTGGGTARLVARLVLDRNTYLVQPLAEASGLTDVFEAWSSVRLAGVRASLTGGDGSGLLIVGLSSRARRSRVPIGGNLSAKDALGAHGVISLDSTSSARGDSTTVMPLPTTRIGLELSAHREGATLSPPDLSIFLHAPGQTHAVVEFEFEVGGSALIELNDADMRPNAEDEE